MSQPFKAEVGVITVEEEEDNLIEGWNAGLLKIPSTVTVMRQKDEVSFSFD